MRTARVSWLVWAIAAIVLLAITLPYGFAAQAAGGDFVFGGFLLNPQDGNSYLAKMYQGWAGSWKFTLPYTAQSSNGAYLFLFYLALGHLARALSLPLILVFHAARLLSAIFMLWALYRFCGAFLKEPRQLWLAFGLAALGAGMGWVLLPFGVLTSDFWVAESFPFLSAYVNPHFPLSLGLLLLILTPPTMTGNPTPASGNIRSAFSQWHVALLSLGMAILSPFAVVMALVILAGVLVFSVLCRRADGRFPLYAGRLGWTALGGLPVLIYDQLATLGDAQLRAWNAQNVTPAPPVWDLIVSFSPLLLLAILGSIYLWKINLLTETPHSPDWRLPLVWAVLGLVLLYLPFDLQRRFLLGWYVPLAVLAAPGLVWISSGSKRRYRVLAAVLLILVLPTNPLVLMASRQAAQTAESQLYLRRAEMKSFDWLAMQAPNQAVVLASPRSGMFIPAHTGRRVVYGHPFETVNAAHQKQAALDFFEGKMDASDLQEFLTQNQVAYIFYGPSERELGSPPYLNQFQPVYESDGVTIYAVMDNRPASTSLFLSGQMR
jgi:hypothetical protein